MKYLFTLLFLSVALVSCSTEDPLIENEEPINQIVNDTTTTITDEEFADENFGNALEANFIGKLTDFDKEPLKEVQITIGGHTTLTDENGVFVLNEVTVKEKFAFVKAQKTGYISGSRALVPTTSGSNFINITLLKKNIVGTVESGESSEVSLPNGARVNFSGSFTHISGAPYTGKVEVSMHYLEPNENSTFTQMPGMLFGKRENNNATILENYGMLAVNLYAPSGEVLNISKDAPAQIRFPISATTPNSPETIPNWYFDEGEGYWKEQGVATKVGNEYLAEVSHFTWWNPCLPLDSVEVCFELNTDVVIANSYFTIERERNNQLVVAGATNDVGLFCGLFPKDEMLKVSIYGSCDNQSPVATQRIGPYPTSSSNIKVKITELSSYLANTFLKATVANCSNASVTDGYAFVYTVANANDFKIIPITNGELNSRFTYCTDNEYRIRLYDVISNEVSSDSNLNIVENGTTNLGQLTTCEEENGAIYEGSVTLETQEEVEAFGTMGYSKITGDLNIHLVSTRNSVLFDPTDITFIVSLANLTSIGGNLKIVNNEIATLRGLENLTSVGGEVLISQNNNLTSLEGLEKLISIGGDATITYNRNLINLKGAEKVTSVGGALEISYNAFLTTLIGLENLASIGNYLKMDGNPNLTEWLAFEKITSISGEILIRDHLNLTSIEELKNITYVGGSITIANNPELTKLTGLENLTAINDGIIITQNKNLTSIDGLINVTSIVGNLSISNNALTSLMPLNNLTSITGNLFISDQSLATLTGLENLSSINGNISISNSNSITSLNGLDKIATISGDLYLNANDNLISLNGLDNLTSIGGNFTVSNNNNLISFEALDKLALIDGTATINRNARLSSLNGMEGITAINGDFTISENNRLNTLEGLESLASIGAIFKIDENDSLTSLTGLDNLNTIGGSFTMFRNKNLISLAGLENLISVGSTITIERHDQNPRLSDFCALTNLFVNGTYGPVNILNNFFNPTVQDIKDGNCNE